MYQIGELSRSHFLMEFDQKPAHGLLIRKKIKF